MAGIYDQYAGGTSLVTAPRGGDDKFAQKTRARIARAEWEDYKRRFRPLENQLLAGLEQPADVGSAMANVDTAFDQARAAAEQRERLYGLQGSQAQQQASARSMQRAEATAKAGAANLAIQRKHDRDMAIMGGGLTGLTAREG